MFERIETICNEEIVKQVGSTFLFDIDGVGKYYLDFKNGAGKVVQSEPDTKPDVTIIMNEQIALKIFNRELKAAAAFMTGQIKARGDLAKVFRRIIFPFRKLSKKNLAPSGLRPREGFGGCEGRSSQRRTISRVKLHKGEISPY